MEGNKQEVKENRMRNIKLAEVVLNCGATGEKLERSVKLLKFVSGKQPIKTLSKRRIPSFGIRPGLEVGCKVTLRGKSALDLIKRLLESINNQLKVKQIGPGKISFGVHEYIQVPGLQFQRDIGIMGFDVNINLMRTGKRVSSRKIKRGRIPARHKISKEETIKFMEKNFNTSIIK
jgi:large subunit ribosomal protein L5